MKWTRIDDYAIACGAYTICKIGPESDKTYELWVGHGAGTSKCLQRGFTTSAQAIAAYQALTVGHVGVPDVHA